jgi:hypothetical protein
VPYKCTYKAMNDAYYSTDQSIAGVYMYKRFEHLQVLTSHSTVTQRPIYARAGSNSIVGSRATHFHYVWRDFYQMVSLCCSIKVDINHISNSYNIFNISTSRGLCSSSRSKQKRLSFNMSRFSRKQD